METAAYHFHCSPELGGMLNLKAGDDAGQVEWLNINPTTERRYGHHARANGPLLQTMMPPLHRLYTASASALHRYYIGYIPVLYRLCIGSISF